LEVLQTQLNLFSEWFSNIHESLVYVSRQTPLRESYYLLDGALGRVYAEEKPSMILGSLFNALEFDFYQLLRDRLPRIDDIMTEGYRNIVLQLPICDRTAPAAWAILAHEIGHAIDVKHGLSVEAVSNVVSEPPAILEAWAGELAADLIAAEVLGPAPILSLLGLEYCMYPRRCVVDWSNSHPATLWRLHAVRDYVDDRGFAPELLSTEIGLYERAWEQALLHHYGDHSMRERVRENSRQNHEDVIRPIAKEIRALIEPLGLPACDIEVASLRRCVSRLKEGLPISAQGSSRASLRGSIEAYRASSDDNRQGDAAAFEKLVVEFAERPVNMSTILASCNSVRRREFEAIEEDPAVLGDAEKTHAFLARLDKLDALVVSSIGTSAVHRDLDLAK